MSTKIKAIFFSMLIFISINANSQLALNNTLTPQQLINNVFAGYGVTISNITFTGNLQAISRFTNGTNTTIGLNGGIVLSTGKAIDCVGPNSVGNITTNNSTGSDPDLAAQVSATLHDAAAFEFDFIPLSDTIKFRYVFSSDEYHEFANSTFNDVFGFFISGPNPLGGTYAAQNIAYIPNTTTPVTINNINNGTANNGPCMNCSYFISNTSGMTIQYDGITVILTAWAKVTPCQTYHFKIAIADAGDSSYDSAVFLEENSFSTNAVTVSSVYSNTSAIQACVEGCNDLNIKLTIPKKMPTNTYIKVDTMWGTATNGVDFPLLPDTVIVPPNSNFAYMKVQPFPDNQLEGTEYFNIVFKTSPCTIDTFKVKIMDYFPIVINSCADTMVCEDTALLYSTPINGIPPYNYSWSPAASLTNPNQLNTKAFPTVTTNYILTVTDSTKCPAAKDTIKVTVNPKALPSFMPDKFMGCEPLTVNFLDYSVPNMASWLWDFGDGTTSTVKNPSHTYASGVYGIKLNVEAPGGCKGEAFVNNIINVWSSPKVNFKADPRITTIDQTTVTFTDLTINPMNWYWNFGDPASSDNSSNIQNPIHTYSAEGFYQAWLVVSTDKGCKDSTSLDIKVVVDEIFLYNVITPNGDGQNDVFYIKNIDRIESSTLYVYDRWGKKVYEEENYKNNWDGENLADGVYYFVLKYKTFFRKGEEQGTITIIRK